MSTERVGTLQAFALLFLTEDIIPLWLLNEWK